MGHLASARTASQDSCAAQLGAGHSQPHADVQGEVLVDDSTASRWIVANAGRFGRADGNVETKDSIELLQRVRSLRLSDLWSMAGSVKSRPLTM